MKLTRKSGRAGSSCSAGDRRIPGNNIDLSIEPFSIFGFRACVRTSNGLRSQTGSRTSVYVRAADLLGCVELTGSSQHE